MKLLTSLILCLGGLALAQPADPTPSADEPPPFECPLCGGNAEAHKVLVARVSWRSGLVMTRTATALFLG